MSTLRSRVESNEWWLAHCQKLFLEDNRRNGQYAREQRESVGISLRGLAKRMEISAMMLSDLERGNRTWNASMLTKWEAALSPENVKGEGTANEGHRKAD